MNYSERASELRKLLTEYQRAYYTTGRALVSDSEYDRLFDELALIEQEHPEERSEDSPTQRVGSDLSSDFPEVQHSIPVLSLDKAYSADEILSFVDKTVKNAGTNLSFALEEKIDGFSIVLYYKDGLLKQAVTRGNGFTGNDVTANAKTIHSIPLRLTKPVSLAVRGEIYLPKAEFERINSSLAEPYANPRNLAAGTIRRIKSSETARVPLSIFCYEGFWENGAGFTDHIEILKELKTLGFPVDPNFSFFCRTREEAQIRLKNAGLEGRACSFDEFPQEIGRRTEQRKTLGYEIDGLVAKVNELSVRDDMGYTEHHPRWAIAYKFEAPQAQSEVEAIDVQVGRTGRITPMARIKATELSGSVIQNVTLHNEDYINGLELAVGDMVAISKRGDVIPAVESVTEKNSKGNTTWKMPSVCPVCSSPLEKRGAHHFCTNNSCPAQEKGKLVFFCAKKQMDIEGLGEKTVELLYDLNYVRTIPDLLTFDYRALIRDGVEGFGKKKVEAIETAIRETKKTPFKRVLTSLGISEFGKKAVDLVVENGFDSMNKLLNEATVENLSAIPGIGTVTANEILTGLHAPEMLSIIDQLGKLGLKMSEDEEEGDELPQIFEGMKWCVTGTFEKFQPRDKAMEEITRRGGVEVSSVSSKTDYLLAGKNAGSKLEKARSLGVKIVSEEQFLEMIGFESGGTEEEQKDLF